MRSRAGAVAFAGILVLVGCGGHAKRREVVTIVSVVAASDEYRADPRDCVVATRRAEVMLVARSQFGTRLCRDLAGLYLRAERGLVWRLPRHPRDAPSVVCNVSRAGAFLQVLVSADDSGRVDSDGICERLWADGWRHRSKWALPPD